MQKITLQRQYECTKQQKHDYIKSIRPNMNKAVPLSRCKGNACLPLRLVTSEVSTTDAMYLGTCKRPNVGVNLVSVITRADLPVGIDAGFTAGEDNNPLRVARGRGPTQGGTQQRRRSRQGRGGSPADRPVTSTQYTALNVNGVNDTMLNSQLPSILCVAKTTVALL